MLSVFGLRLLRTLPPVVLTLWDRINDLALIPLPTLVDWGWDHFDGDRLGLALVTFAVVRLRSQPGDYFYTLADNSLSFLAMEVRHRSGGAVTTSAMEDGSEESTLALLEAQVHLTEADFCHQQDHPSDALIHAERALRDFVAFQDSGGVGRSLSQLGQIYLAQGQVDRAVAYGQAAVAVLADTAAIAAQAAAWHGLGLARAAQGDWEGAQTALNAALDRYYRLGQPDAEVHTLIALGQVYVQRREFMFALACYEAALDLGTTRPHHRRAMAQTLIQVGELCEATDRPLWAIAPYEDALDRYRQLGDDAQVQHLYRRLGRLHEALGQVHQALQCYQQAMQPQAVARLREFPSGSTLSPLGFPFLEFQDRSGENRAWGE
jgi:tetratricopeptide (TPR) repeat protein